MKKSLVALCLTACCTFSVLAPAQNQSDSHVRARFAVLPQKAPALNAQQNAGTLQQWNGMFTFQNQTYNFVMVGADPAANQTAVIPTYIIPIKIIIGSTTFDPTAGGASSALSRTLTSPVFDHSTTYVQGGTNVGRTQYVDAFQRANFWSIVQNNVNSHVILGGVGAANPVVLPTLTLNVPPQDGHIGHPFGPAAGEVDINYFDAQLNAYITAHSQINPTTFPIFVANDVYLTEGGCCIGGYHSATGQQTYAFFDYDDHPGVFSQDVSALSHEVSEWMDDPLTNGFNNTPCGFLEVGDPLEGGPNFGSFPYVLHGFTYNLQDEVFLRYFGGPADTSVHSWWSFQNFPFTQVCQNGA